MQSEQFQLHAEIEQRHWWFVARRRILRHLVAQVLPPSPDTTVVDIGCGTGANIAALSEDYRCVGIDTSAEGIELAKKRFSGVEFHHGFAPHDIPEAMQQADLVLMTDVLEHVPDDFRLLSDILASTRPGTKILLTVPADHQLWSPHDEVFGHYRRYDAQRLHQVWVGLPVRTRLISYYNSRLYPIVKFVRRLNQLRGAATGAAGTDFTLPRSSVNRLLEEIFASEARVLTQLLEGRRTTGFRRGVSLIALLEREEGPVTIRDKPGHITPDLFDPQAHLVAAGV